VDKRLAILPVHYRAPRTWASVEQFVRNERLYRGDELAFYNAFEHLVAEIQRADIVRMSHSIFPPARRSTATPNGKTTPFPKENGTSPPANPTTAATP
jgi:hypothetical protein